jgi:hypothetical protein
MRYINLENNQLIDYTIEQLLIDNSNAKIYKKTKMPNEQLIANYSVYPLITEAAPDTNEDETVEESTPEFRNGEWHQTWRVRKLTQKEIDMIVESRQTDFNISTTDSEDNTTNFSIENLSRTNTAVTLNRGRTYNFRLTLL